MSADVVDAVVGLAVSVVEMDGRMELKMTSISVGAAALIAGVTSVVAGGSGCWKVTGTGCWAGWAAGIVLVAESVGCGAGWVR